MTIVRGKIFLSLVISVGHSADYITAIGYQYNVDQHTICSHLKSTYCTHYVKNIMTLLYGQLCTNSNRLVHQFTTTWSINAIHAMVYQVINCMCVYCGVLSVESDAIVQFWYFQLEVYELYHSHGTHVLSIYYA